MNGRNITIAHNTFTIPIITPTVGILDWNKKEIKDLDIMTRKIISVNGGFHLVSDVNRLYTSRTKGCRGITSIENMYESRTIGIMKHLEKASDTNSLIQMVRRSEKNNVMRLGKEFEKHIQEGQGTGKVTDSMTKDHEKKWKEKVTHVYLQSQIEKDDTIDQKATNNWLQQRFSAHVEGYIMSIQEQELDTKETRKRREKNQEKKNRMDIRCRMCNENDETVYHLICSCPKLAPTLYLEARHSQIARILYQEIMKNEKISYNPRRVTIKNEIELWWDMEIHTVTKVKKNQPDIVLTTCSRRVSISVPEIVSILVWTALSARVSWRL